MFLLHSCEPREPTGAGVVGDRLFAVSPCFRPNYDPLDMAPVRPSTAPDQHVSDHPWMLGNYVDYGHNLEAAWLLADSVEELRSRGAVNSSTAAGMLGVLQELGDAAVTAGYDTIHGGM